LGVFALNTYNFFWLYCDTTRIPAEHQWRTLQYEDAYQSLKKLSDQTGALYVFNEFNTDYDNKTLDIADYPFNALQNPKLSKTSPQWTAVIANVHYAPYFIKTFPHLKFKILKSDRPTPPTPFGLFLIPVSDIPIPILNNWRTAEEVYLNANIEIKNKTPMETWSHFNDSFSSLQNRFPNNTFLIAIYWEKYAFYKCLDRDFNSAADAYQNAVKQGWPTAHLYYDQGLCLKLTGKNAEAKKAFQQAANLEKEMPVFPQAF
jgi:hypothetical protein